MKTFSAGNGKYVNLNFLISRWVTLEKFGKQNDYFLRFLFQNIFFKFMCIIIKKKYDNLYHSYVS